MPALATKTAPNDNSAGDSAPAGIISFERTEDIHLIRSIVAHPKVYGFLHDDEGPLREDWVPGFGGRISWMAVRYDGVPIGIIVVREHSSYLWELHYGFLPEAWGGLALECFREFIRGVWRYSKCRRVYGQILASNRRSLKFARAAGAVEFATHPRSIMKYGKMQDQILVAIDRPAELATEVAIPATGQKE